MLRQRPRQMGQCKDRRLGTGQARGDKGKLLDRLHGCQSALSDKQSSKTQTIEPAEC